MNVSIIWNVWNNYEDVLLGSEIVRLENKRAKVFDNLYLYAQGGYPNPPSDIETTYLDGYYEVKIDEKHPLIKEHVKFKGVFRVLNGLKKAYEYGLNNGSDFAIMTNGDAWFLNIEKLGELLGQEETKNSAISARIGTVAGLYNNYGDFIPFFDDHFMIINLKKCHEYKIFNYDTPKAYNANFLRYGGIHYMLIAMMDELVPDGLFNIYTTVEDGVNHYGESSGFSLLPWQYQPSNGFLHANCTQESYLHHLRAYLLEVLGFDKYPYVKKYCKQYKKRDDMLVNDKKIVFYKKNFKEKIEFKFIQAYIKVRYFLLKYIIYKQELKYLQTGYNHKKYFDIYANILPLEYVSRRPKKNVGEI